MSKEATISAQSKPSAIPAATVTTEKPRDPHIDDRSYGHFNIQSKLTVGAPDDPYEKEADSVADKVMRMPDNHFAQRKCAHCEEEGKLQRKPLGESITPYIQRKSETAPAVSASTSQSIETSKGGGSRMDSSTESYMSSRFGGDFSNVRIHNDGQSSRLNRDLNAKAFTVGNDIYFNEGQYQPASSSGKHLLAHELTHVVQQNSFIQQKSIQRKIQRQEDEQEEPIQAKLMNNAPHVQLKCSECGEKDKIQRQEDEQEEPIQTKPLDFAASIQRKCEDCKKEDEKPLLAQKKAMGNYSVPFIQKKTNEAAAAPQPAAAPIVKDSACAAVSKPETAESPAAENKSAAETTPATPPPAEKPSPPQPAKGNIPSGTKVTVPKTEAPKPAESPAAKKSKKVDGDPAFDAVIGDTRKNAKKQKDHEKPDAKVDKAEQASDVKNEQAVNAGAVVISVNDQVNKENQKPKEFNAAEFKRQLKEKISAGIPNDEKPVKEFIKDDTGVNAITADTKKNVGTARDEVVSDTKKIGSSEAANPEAKNEIYSRPGTEYQSEQSGTKPVIGHPERAIPKPVSDEDLQMDEEHNADSLDKEMSKNEMTDDQLADSEEPKFIDTLKEKQTAQKELCQVPGNLKDAESTKLQQSTGDAKHLLDKDMNSMFTHRDDQMKQVGKGQKDVTSEEEQRLKEYYAKITLIHGNTEINVKNSLTYLECTVSCAFEEAIAVAFEQFKKNVSSRLDYYYDWHIINPDYEKEDKMTDAFVNKPLDDKIYWLELRKIAFLPDSRERKEFQRRIDDLKSQKVKLKLNQIFDEEKALFVSSMDLAIDNISIMVSNGLNEAKAIISKGRDAVQCEYDCLDDANKEKAKETTDDFISKFEDLDNKVNDKEDELSDTLAKQYIETTSKLKKEFEDIRAEAALHWWERAWRKIKEIATIIYELGKTLLNILIKAANVIGDIIRHPIRFFDNLISAISLGFRNFIKRLPKHLEEIIFKLIIGVVPPDITLPDQWDVKGIFSFVLQILGLSKENIRNQAIKRFGEPIVQKLEQGFELFVIFKNEGFSGLWEHVKEKIGNIKDAIIEEVKTFFQESIIQAAVEFIISALTPASGFIKVCKSIVSIVMFLVKNLQNLLQLLDNILDSLADVAVGKIDKAAEKVENAITDILLVGIKFLAALVGINLDKIQAKISKIINAVRNPVNRALAWLFDKAEEFARRTGLLRLIEKGKEKYHAGKKWTQDKIEKGKEKVKGAVAALVNWLGFKKEFKSKDGGNHRIFFKGSKQSPVLMVASDETPVEKLLKAKKATDAKAATAYDFYTTSVKTQEQKVLVCEEAYKSADSENKRAARYKHQTEVQTLRETMKDFADLLSQVSFEGAPGGTVRTKVTKELKGNRAHKVEASPLTYLPGDEVGSPPSEDPPGWSKYAQNATDKWVRGHLLSEHLHGPGRKWNLTPVSQSVNSAMEGVESTVKPLIKDQTQVLYYKSAAYYDDSRPTENEKNIPFNIQIHWGTLIKDPSNPTNVKEHQQGSLNEKQGLPTLDGPPNLNNVGRSTLDDNGIGKTNGRLSRDIVRCRDEFIETNGEFSNYRDLIDKLKKYYNNELTPKTGIYPDKWLKAFDPSFEIILEKAIEIDKTLKIVPK